MEKIFFAVGTCGMFVLTIYFHQIARKTFHQRHPFFALLMAPTTIASMVYLLMCLGFGLYQTDTLQTNLLRYLDWLITTPIIIAILAILLIPSKNPLMKPFIIILAVCQVFIISTGLVALLIPEQSDLYYLLGCTSFLILLVSLFAIYQRFKSQRSDIRNQLASRLLIYTAIIWTIYPIIWILHTPEINFADYDTETAIYMVLDLFAKGIFVYLILKDTEVVQEIIL